MRAVIVPEPGDTDVLTLAEVPDPQPAEREVLIRVAAAGLNGADLAQRRGFYPPPPGAPSWPGLEVSGEIAGLGAAVTEWSVGDRVCALLSGGGYADFVTVDAGLVLPIPPGVDLVEAAGLPEVTATVYSNVFQLAGLQPGEILLAHGGTSGIGSMAVQLGAAFGARVFTTAGSAEKVAFARDLGAEVSIDYREQDFVEVVRDVTDGRGVDVVLDIVGGDYIARDLAALATGGRIMSIANRGSAPSTIDVGLLMRKRARLWG
ncbi:MAG TPA: NAD(P)H-quinone oxidoreductase, partial [Leifsonia sp.]|nr:NAD(P)H-quinone oxidoreductase [Leifsonia sp.]